MRPLPPTAKLSEADVRSMRLRHSLGKASVRQLAAEHGMAAESVRKILRYETWAWVAEEGPGATHEEWAAARPEPTEAEIAASKARFVGLLEPTGEGLARLQAETAKATKGERILDELVKPDGGKE